MAKKKVFIAITKSEWGGAQKYVHDIALAVRETCDVSVLVSGTGELVFRLQKESIRVIPLLYSQRDIALSKEIKFFVELYHLLKSEKPDVLHVNSSKMGLVGAIVGRITRVPHIIFTAHGWAFNEERPFWQKWIFRMLHIITVLLSHTTIAVSEITKKQLGWPWNKKVVVIYNGVKSIEFLSRDEARAMLAEKIKGSVPPDTSWIGTISELHTTKGLRYAIEAVSQLTEHVVFIVIGDGHEREKIERYAQEYKVTDKVFFVGRIPEASRLLHAFDIVTLTSITEALPYFLLEAGLAKRAIVASAVGGIPEIITHRETGILVPPRNSLAIQEALTSLLHNPNEADVLGEHLYKKIERNFSEKNMITQTVQLYTK